VIAAGSNCCQPKENTGGEAGASDCWPNANTGGVLDFCGLAFCGDASLSIVAGLSDNPLKACLSLSFSMGMWALCVIDIADPLRPFT